MKLVALLALAGALSVSAVPAFAHDYSKGCPKLDYIAPKSVVEACTTFDEARQRFLEAEQALTAFPPGYCSSLERIAEADRSAAAFHKHYKAWTHATSRAEFDGNDEITKAYITPILKGLAFAAPGMAAFFDKQRKACPGWAPKK